MVQVLVRYMWVLFLMVIFASGATAVSFSTDTTPEFIFEQGQNASLLFSCVDQNDFSCDSTFTCNLSVFSPNSSVLVDNQQATKQTNYFNYSLPETNTLGIHRYDLFCSNATDAGASTELTYLVNLTGEDLSISKTILYIFVLLVTLTLFLLSLLGAIKIPWNNRIDEDGFIVGMNDLKYVKLGLWFITYLLLIFMTWLTASVAKFLELGMAANFFDFVYLGLLVFVLPVFIIVTVTGFVKVFSDKNISNMLERNLRVQ